jgi:phenylacetic acid degradation operon negative regulatory protein
MARKAVPNLRSQDLVFTLFGDYLLERDRPVWTGGLITLLGQLGLSPMAVRTVLSRMTRKGWLTAERLGTRSWYGLTPKGRKLLESGRERIYHPTGSATWDSRWSVVVFSIPETRRRLRDALRVRLSWLGCGPLTSGVWISPHDVHAQILDIAAELKLARNLEIFRGEHLAHSSPERLVAQCWDLAGLDRRYAAFISRWKGEFEHCDQCGMTGAKAGVHKPCTAPADCFRRRFLLVHEYRAFPLDDPYLPRQLLPASWHGEAAARLFETYHDALAGPAERYVANVCAEGDEIVAAA